MPVFKGYCKKTQKEVEGYLLYLNNNGKNAFYILPFADAGIYPNHIFMNMCDDGINDYQLVKVESDSIKRYTGIGDFYEGDKVTDGYNIYEIKYGLVEISDNERYGTNWVKGFYLQYYSRRYHNMEDNFHIDLLVKKQ